MKFTKVIIVLIVFVVAAIVIYSFFSTESSDVAYLEEIQAERKEKDLFMKDSEESPFGEYRDTFTGLKYFPITTGYRVTANVEPIKDKKVITVATSTNETKQYLEYAWANFDLEGVKCRLLLLEVMDMGPERGKLFVGFADKTSAVDTYGAGRYLDVKKQPGAGTVILDFNKAYNPYCAYVDGYSCPLPVKENILDVTIHAGEKNYHD
jgi:uncharacterized protein (DUF1684 family)